MINIIVEEFKSYPKGIKITLAVIAVIVAGFAVSAAQIFFGGLYFTDMNNQMAWAAWIVGDLSLIVLGGGAFFTGFLFYIFRRDELAPIMNSAVLIGLLCYTFTFAFLIFDIGQPLRFWFGFIYPNWGENLLPKSMMTEVVFCISLYWSVLVVEFIPPALKHRVLDKHPVIHAIGHYMHKLMWIMAAAGTFLSFFHQGSLGGLYDVLYAKPGWHRPHHMLFFMSVVSALAAGPSFTCFVTMTAQRIKKKELIPEKTWLFCAKLIATTYSLFFLFRAYDIYVMATEMVPSFDRSFIEIWGGPFGIWYLLIEIALIITTIIILAIKKFRMNADYRYAAVISGVLAMVVNRFNLNFHGASISNFPWRDFMGYFPTVQEWFITLGVFALMTIIYMWCAKYLPLFPHAEHGEEHESH